MRLHLLVTHRVEQDRMRLLAGKKWIETGLVFTRAEVHLPLDLRFRSVKVHRGVALRESDGRQFDGQIV
jgi:hypothetical protein